MKAEKYRIIVHKQTWDFNYLMEARQKIKEILDTGLWFIELEKINIEDGIERPNKVTLKIDEMILDIFQELIKNKRTSKVVLKKFKELMDLREIQITKKEPKSEQKVQGSTHKKHSALSHKIEKATGDKGK